MNRRLCALFLAGVLLLTTAACSGSTASSSPAPASSAAAVAAASAPESDIVFRQQVFTAEKPVAEQIGAYGITFTDETLELPYKLIFDKVTKSDRIEQSVLTEYQTILSSVTRGTKISLTAEQLFTLEAFTQLDVPFYLASVQDQEMTACYINGGDKYLVIESTKLLPT